jgi:hypothetical protein
MIIGFSGPAGAGKSTAAKILVDQRGFRLVKFAGPLKAMLRAILPGDDVNEWIEGALKETVHPVLGCTPRHAMQTLGTEWGRKCIDPDLWVNLAAAEILSIDDDVVLDDVRFENEAEMIRSLGGVIIEIRPKYMTHHMTHHVSESGVRADRWIYNDSDVQSLALMLMSMVPLPG